MSYSETGPFNFATRIDHLRSSAQRRVHGRLREKRRITKHDSDIKTREELLEGALALVQWELRLACAAGGLASFSSVWQRFYQQREKPLHLGNDRSYL